MKRILCVLALVFMMGCGKHVIKFPYTQEYIPGQGNIKGNVDTDYFLAEDEAFEIGANENGYAVFKSPDKAFAVLCEKYADDIKIIQDEFHLPALTAQQYDPYKKLGSQLTSGTEKQQEQARFISAFLDIYENSFISN